MILRNFAVAVVFTTLATAALSGCGGSKFPMAEVKGKVLIDGQPAAGGNVTFLPDATAGNKGLMSSGQINAQGEFTLVNAEGLKGAGVGHYRVLVMAPFDAAGSGSSATGDTSAPAKAATVQIPPKYSDPTNTDLKAEVQAGKVNEITLELRSK